MKEARYAILSAVVLAFGRAISEVGVAMMIGGNILGQTRVLTTAIALQTGLGDFGFSIALGIILLAIALVVVIILNLVTSVCRSNRSLSEVPAHVIRTKRASHGFRSQEDDPRRDRS